MTELPALGTRLAGRYRIKEQLEQHALGGLFTAVYEPFESRVFMEMIHPDSSGFPRSTQNCHPPDGLVVDGPIPQLHECLQRAALMRGPHLCGVIEWFEEEGFTCVVSEFTPGISLRELLDEAGSLPLDQALEILGACVEAAGAAYGCGVYYLALDPRNLLITPSGPVKLMRAGYFQVLESADPLLQHESMLYRAPEVLRGAPSRPADVYALAVMLREMMGPSRPPRLEAVLARATTGEPAGRPTARPFLEALLEEAASAKREAHGRHVDSITLARPLQSERRGTVRRYLIALVILLAAAYLMARFISGCRPVQPGSHDLIPGVNVRALTGEPCLRASFPVSFTPESGDLF